jgi:peroxin-2
MVLTVFLPYLMQKMNDLISKNGWDDPRKGRSGKLIDKFKYFFARIIGLLNNLYKLASLLNLILFFVTHVMRSLPERLLGISLVRIDANQRRYVDFTYINRLIVWTALGHSLSSLLPFLDISSIKSMFTMSSKLTEFITLDEKDINGDSWCGICGSTHVCMPYKTKDCGHLFCYYCIKSVMQEAEEEDDVCKCKKCG